MCKWLCLGADFSCQIQIPWEIQWPFYSLGKSSFLGEGKNIHIYFFLSIQ